MRPMESIGLHPSELEFAHYLRGTLAHEHAVALFAHSVLCGQCQQRLESLLEATTRAPPPNGLRRTGEPGQ